jgi:hypothetical protein
MSFVNGSAQGRQPLHPKRVVFSNSYGVGNRTTISDSRSNFHTRVGYRMSVCRRRFASDLARASDINPAQGALEDHRDRLSGSLHHSFQFLLMHLEKIGPSPICGRKIKACLNRNSSQKPTAENGSSVAEFLG